MQITRLFLKNIIVTLLLVMNLGGIFLYCHPALAFPYSNDSIWPVLVDHFNLPDDDPHQKDIQAQLEWYQHNHRFVHRATKNAQSYLYYVYQQTQKYHVPAEIALIPMIESEYQPISRSRVGAVGLWQLMPPLASDYGIKMNWWYDGRRDLTTSTRVAIRYLVYLHDVFDNNWLLAIAAYDAGAGTVQNAMRYNKERGRPTDFWALQLPRETEIYVPKLLALATIIRNPREYGFSLSPILDKPIITTNVKIKKQMNIATIAHDAHISIHKAKELNPALLHQKTPPHQSYTLILPKNQATVFKKQLIMHKKIKVMPIAKNIAPATKTISKETDLANILGLKDSKSNMVTAVAQNKNIIDRLFDKLIGANHVVSNPPSNMISKKIITKTIHPKIYRVKPGDNLRVIAARHHTTISRLMSVNHLHSALLRIGQTLQIPNVF